MYFNGLFFSGLGFFLPDAVRILGHVLPEDTGWWVEESGIEAQETTSIYLEKGKGGMSQEQQSMPTDQLLSRLEWVR